MDISKKQLDGFFQVLKRYGYSDSSFTLKAKNLISNQADQLTPSQTTIEVIENFSQIKKEYQGGQEANWLERFEEDLQDGFFNSNLMIK